MVLAAAPALQRAPGDRALPRTRAGRPAQRGAGATSTGCDGPGRDGLREEQQRRFVLIRLEFNDVLSQFDLFTEVITQRSEHETGVWLSGLDVLAADALRTRPPRAGLEPPPVVCYLARGPGAAIRRARTRLPGGGRTRCDHPGAAGAHGRAAASRPRSSTRSGTRARRCSGWWSRCGASIGRAQRRGSAGVPWGSWDALDQRDRRRLLVGRQARDHLDPRACSPWSACRRSSCSGRPARPASGAVPAGAAQRQRSARPSTRTRSGRALADDLASALSPSTTCRRARRAESERLEDGDARDGRPDGRRTGRRRCAGSALGDILPLAERRPEQLLGPAPGLGRRRRRAGPAAADARLRGARPGQGRRSDQPRRRRAGCCPTC